MGGALGMRKLQFVGLFLVTFAAFLVVWNVTGGARSYTAAILRLAGVIGPMMHGWVLETPLDGRGVPTWVHGNNHVQAAIQFDALAVSVVPLVSLLAVTPGLRARRRASLMLTGATLCFLVDVLIVALFPLLVFYKNAFTDVLGTFLGLIVFVGAPVIIWFILTFRQLQEVLPSLRAR
jgi:hypothetical protein